MSDPKTITVQGVEVQVAQPYAEGHTVTEAEAKALNQVRAENIANNCRKAIKELIEEAGEITDAVKKAALKMIAEKDKDYVFTLASVGGGGSRLDPLTKECRAIARSFINGKIKEAEMTVKGYIEANGEDAYKSKIVELSEHPEIVKTAKKALAEREKMANIAGDLEL